MKLNQKGVTLVNVMVAAAVGSILTYAMMRVIGDSLSGQRQIEFKAESQNLRNSIIDELSLREACRLSFAGVNPTTNAPIRNQIFKASGEVFRETFAISQASYELGRIRINRIFFQTAPNHTYRAVGSDPLRGTAEVTLELVNTGAVDQTTRDPFIRIPLSVELNSSGQIVRCVALGNDETSIWKLSGPEAYYNEGQNVGIGTDNPDSTLHVLGNVNAAGEVTAGRVEVPAVTLEVSPGVQGDIEGDEIRATTFLYVSDKKLKQNIKTILDFKNIEKLSPVSFNWKKNGSKAFGFIAQDVENFFEHTTSKVGDKGILAIDYSQLMGIFIEEIKSLDRKRSELEKRVQILEQRLNNKKLKN